MRLLRRVFWFVRLFENNYFSLTAVPYAKISAAPCITIEVTNRMLIIASAPWFAASLTIRLNASSRDCEII